MSYGVILLLDWPLPGLRVGVDNVLKNALVESGLANARALAHFFGDKKSDVHFTAYAPKWSDDVTKIASEIDGPISRYLGHASYGGKKGEPHPGQWPLPEMAVILVGAGARFVDSLGSEAGWFIRLRLRRSVGWPVSSAMISKSLPTELSKQRSTDHCGVGPRPVGQFPVVGFWHTVPSPVTLASTGPGSRPDQLGVDTQLDEVRSDLVQVDGVHRHDERRS